MTSNRILVIGDIHGCSQALQTLIEAIDPQSDDLLVTLGDYVDRGPDSKGVIDLLLDLQQRCQLVPLLGNHELMMLSVIDEEADSTFWLTFGGRQTLNSYGGEMEQIPEEHLEFFRQCVPFFETDDFIFVHANYAAHSPLDAQPERLLFWEHLSAITPPPHTSGKTVFVGHTPQPSGEIWDLGHLICLDTCCFGGGWLTALEAHSRQVWQADILGKLREKD
jgi:serine/threonine protein phosphatase 1